MRLLPAVGLAAANTLLHLAQSTQASTIPVYGQLSDLIPRAAQCPTDPTLSQCGQGLPTNFCCPPDQTCIPIDNNNGALCCPHGLDCTSIIPVAGACNASAYDAEKTPNSPVHLVKIPSTFTPCNGSSTCCPPGFTCSNNRCVVQGNNSVSASATATATSAVSLVSAHSTPTGSTDTSSSASTVSSSVSSSNDSDEFPPVAVLVGFFPGLLAGSLFTFLLVMCIGRRRKQRAAAASALRKHSDSNSSLGPVRAHISDPIYQEDGAGRVDFLHRNQPTSSTPSAFSPQPRRSPGIGRIRSLFSTTTTGGQTPRGLGVGMDEPSTPIRGLKREPSMESIKIFSPPEMRVDGDMSGNRNTTYSDVLRAAGATQHHDPMPNGYRRN